MKTFPLIAAALAMGCVSVETVAADAGTKIDPGQTNEPLRVALTFDDSLKDHLLIAAPMLEERGWRGTFCIVTDWVGKDSSKLTWDDVRELVRRGHEIATHTKTHRNLVELLKADKGDEVRRVPNVIMGESYHTDIEDALRAMARAGERGEALFIVSHGISRGAKGISMKTEWLERMLSSAKEMGVLVRGVR